MVFDRRRRRFSISKIIPSTVSPTAMPMAMPTPMTIGVLELDDDGLVEAGFVEIEGGVGDGGEGEDGMTGRLDLFDMFVGSVVCLMVVVMVSSSRDRVGTLASAVDARFTDVSAMFRLVPRSRELVDEA